MLAVQWLLFERAVMEHASAMHCHRASSSLLLLAAVFNANTAMPCQQPLKKFLLGGFPQFAATKLCTIKTGFAQAKANDFIVI